jgi:hypothetical protein
LQQLLPTVEALDTVIFEGREIQSTQEIHRKELRVTTKRSREVEARGRNIRNQLVAGLQGIYGVDSYTLLEFGVNPRLPQKRKRLTQEEREEKERLEALEKAAAEAGLKVDV